MFVVFEPYFPFLVDLRFYSFVCRFCKRKHSSGCANATGEKGERNLLAI